MASHRVCLRILGAGAPTRGPRRTTINARVPSTECIPMPKNLGYYVYSSTPKPCKPARPKYRSGSDKPQNTSDYYNLMCDPRVYRGGTFRTFQPVEKERLSAQCKRKPSKRKPRPTLFGGIERPKTPPDIGGRGTRVPVEKFLEEYVEPVAEADAEAQTDYIDPKPPRDCPVVAKIGYDVSTEMDVRDLYSFEEEVEPIVEALADKVVQQSILEIMEEEELLDLRTRQNEYEDRRRVAQLEQHLLRVRQRAVFEEQEKLVKRYIQEIREEQELEEGVCATHFSRSYLMNLIPQLLIGLENEGLVTAAHLGEILESVQPWLTKEVLGEIDKKIVSRALLDEIIRETVDHREADMAASGIQEPQPAPEPGYLLPEYEEE